MMVSRYYHIIDKIKKYSVELDIDIIHRSDLVKRIRIVVFCIQGHCLYLFELKILT